MVLVLLALGPFRLLQVQCRQLAVPFLLLQVAVSPLVKLVPVSVQVLVAHAPALVVLVCVLVLEVVPVLVVLVVLEVLVLVAQVAHVLVARVVLVVHVLVLLLALVVQVVLVVHVLAALAAVLAALVVPELVVPAAVLVLAAVLVAHATMVNVARLAKNLVHVVGPSSMNCSRNSLATQIAMLPFLRAPSSLNVAHRHKSLLRS